MYVTYEYDVIYDVIHHSCYQHYMPSFYRMSSQSIIQHSVHVINSMCYIFSCNECNLMYHMLICNICVCIRDRAQFLRLPEFGGDFLASKKSAFELFGKFFVFGCILQYLCFLKIFPNRLQQIRSRFTLHTYVVYVLKRCLTVTVRLYPYPGNFLHLI